MRVLHAFAILIFAACESLAQAEAIKVAQFDSSSATNDSAKLNDAVDEFVRRLTPESTAQGASHKISIE